MSTEELRAIWLAAGGTFHGRLVEYGSMNEEALYPLLKEVVYARRLEALKRGSPPSDHPDFVDMGYADGWAELEELRKEIYSEA